MSKIRVKCNGKHKLTFRLPSGPPNADAPLPLLLLPACLGSGNSEPSCHGPPALTHSPPPAPGRTRATPPTATPPSVGEIGFERAERRFSSSATMRMCTMRTRLEATCETTLAGSRRLTSSSICHRCQYRDDAAAPSLDCARRSPERQRC